MSNLASTQQCRHFGVCGGCSLLDVPIAEQLAQKQRRARDLLAPFLDGIEPAITLPPRPPRHDRTTILYPAQLRDGELQLGIYRTGTHEIEPIEDCRIQHKTLTALAVRVGELLRELHLPVWNEATGHGLVRAFRARVMGGTNELLLGLVTSRTEFSERDRLTRELQALGSGLRDEQGKPIHLVGIVQNVNPQPGNVLLGPIAKALRGDVWQHDHVGGLRFRVSWTSFYQLNRHAEAILFKPALALLGDVKGLQVVDGYGGVGTFMLRLLRGGAAHVVSIESSPSACADARANLRANGFGNGDVREEPFGARPLPACDLLVVDPPRAGLLAQGTAAITGAMPARVLLVSCSLASLARDLAALVPAYRVTACQLCDLFPHTEHVEVLTMLERR